jgi:plasmid maintenance system killer protein
VPDGPKQVGEVALILEANRRSFRKFSWTKQENENLNLASDLRDLKSPPGNRLEGLKGDLKGFHSIRINDQWRVVFRWSAGNAFDVQIVDYR